jgi:transposase-like protein
MSGRVVPYQCPYCGEEDLRPYEPEEDDAVSQPDASLRSAWHCRVCTRVFTLKFHGMAVPRATAAPPSPPSAAERHLGGDPPPDPDSE